MKTIKHPDTYQCEICGAEYKTQFMAERCESRRTDRKTDIQIGDKVLCESRYDGFFELTVVDIFLNNNWHLQSWEKDNLNRFLPRRQTTLREYIYVIAKQDSHEWILKTNDSLTVCKDGSCSDIWHEDSVCPLKNIIWNENYDEMPILNNDQYCFIKWIEDDDIVIRRGSKSWFDKHWKDKVQFVAFSNVI